MGVARRLAAERVVTAPDGRVWRVRRRWRLSLRRRRFGVPGLGGDVLALGDLADVASIFESLALLAVGIVVVAALALLIVFVLPLVLLVLEAVALAVWVGVLGRSWVVEAATADPPREALSLEARGWRGSRRAVDELAGAIERGDPVEAGR